MSYSRMHSTSSTAAAAPNAAIELAETKLVLASPPSQEEKRVLAKLKIALKKESWAKRLLTNIGACVLGAIGGLTIWQVIVGGTVMLFTIPVSGPVMTVIAVTAATAAVGVGAWRLWRESRNYAIGLASDLIDDRINLNDQMWSEEKDKMVAEHAAMMAQASAQLEKSKQAHTNQVVASEAAAQLLRDQVAEFKGKVVALEDSEKEYKVKVATLEGANLQLLQKLEVQAKQLDEVRDQCTRVQETLTAQKLECAQLRTEVKSGERALTATKSDLARTDLALQHLLERVAVMEQRIPPPASASAPARATAPIDGVEPSASTTSTHAADAAPGPHKC